MKTPSDRLYFGTAYGPRQLLWQQKDQNAYGKTTDLTFIGGSQYVYSFGKCLFMPADLTAGLEYNRDNLKDDMWGYNRYTKQTVNIGSAFCRMNGKRKMEHSLGRTSG